VDQIDPPAPSESGSHVSEHAQDYLENLRARFDELTGRIEEVTRVTAEREGDAPPETTSGTGSAVDEAPPAPIDPSPAAEVDVDAFEPSPRTLEVPAARAPRVTARSLPRPVISNRTGSRAWIFATIGAVVALGAVFLIGRWADSTDEAAPEPTPTTAAPLPTAPPTDGEILAEAQAAIDASGASDVIVTFSGGTATLQGTVRDAALLDALADDLLAIEGVRRLDNRLEVFVPTPPEPEELQAAAEQALADTGFEQLTVAVVDGVATISGVAPFDELADGFFAYSAPVRDALLEIEGIDSVATRLQLRGDEGSLRAELRSLTEASPIIFGSGSAELDDEAAAALDQAAEIIIAHPGLRVLIAGHTDSAGGAAQNEQLAAARGGAVLQYLLSKGVPATRLQAVSYGELFPGQDQALNRRIEFEVAP
jgi:outer membrane protein OmpA-like peptidoglycan-associated protein